MSGYCEVSFLTLSNISRQWWHRMWRKALANMVPLATSQGSAFGRSHWCLPLRVTHHWPRVGETKPGDHRKKNQKTTRVTRMGPRNIRNIFAIWPFHGFEKTMDICRHFMAVRKQKLPCPRCEAQWPTRSAARLWKRAKLISCDVFLPSESLKRWTHLQNCARYEKD